jgi:hypothetical protein
VGVQLLKDLFENRDWDDDGEEGEGKRGGKVVSMGEKGLGDKVDYVLPFKTLHCFMCKTLLLPLYVVILFFLSYFFSRHPLGEAVGC